MLQISISLSLRDKTQLDLLLKKIQRYDLGVPVSIVELSKSFSIDFETDYEQYELIRDFANEFPDHELVDNIESGNEDILLAVHRTQSSMSSDGWGRHWNEDNITTQVYLVKKKVRKNSVVSNKFKVLFGTEIKEYEVPIYVSTNPDTQKKVYFVAKEFPPTEEKPVFISNSLETVNEAFWYGYNRIQQEVIEGDYKEYVNQLKKKKRAEARKQAAKAKKGIIRYYFQTKLNVACVLINKS